MINFIGKFWTIKSICKKRIYKLQYGSKLSFGKNVTFRDGFHIFIPGGAIKIGNDCFFNHYCTLDSRKKITIGDGCLFGENIKIYDNNHHFSDFSLSLHDSGFSSEEITIGRHCWIGSNVVILKGAKIGDNCVIGAGSVVDGKTTIPSGSIYIRRGISEIIPIKIKGKL